MIVLTTKFARRQLRFTLHVCFICLSCGAFLGYTSSAIHSIIEDKTFATKLTISDIAWIVWFGAVCGCLITAARIGIFGPRGIILYFTAPSFLLSWLGIYFSYSILGIFLSRFLGGLGTGIATSSAPLYVVGIASPQNRGRLGILPQLLMLLGILISYCLGSVHALSCCILVLPSFVLLAQAPDTPHWLVSRDKPEEALAVLEDLQGKSEATEEFTRLTALYLKSTQKLNAPCLKDKPTLKALLIALGIVSFQQLSGINGVTFYAVTIFKHNDTRESLAPLTLAIILASTQCLASFTSSFLIDRLGRKILLVVSGYLTSLSSCCVAIYFYWGADHYYQNLFWVPLLILIVFAFGFAIGYGAVTWLLITEILSEETKHVLNPFILAYSWLCVFAVTKSFPFLFNLVNIYGIFWCYSICSLVGIFFVLFFAPETKGRSLEEIRQHFEGGIVNTQSTKM